MGIIFLASPHKTSYLVHGFCTNALVLKEVSTNQPVYLTRNGRGAYAIVEVDELDRLKAMIKLLAKLEEGEQSAREKGWLTAIETVLLQPYFTSSLPGFRQFAGRFGDHGSRQMQ